MFDRKLLTLGALAGVAYDVFEVAGVIVGGISNPIQNHVSNVLAKLHVVDRTQAAIRGREAGLG